MTMKNILICAHGRREVEGNWNNVCELALMSNTEFIYLFATPLANSAKYILE